MDQPMRFVVKHTDGRIETGQIAEENMTLGLGGTLTPCLCGTREFVDAWRSWPPVRNEPGRRTEELPIEEVENHYDPDRICPSCRRVFWYFDDEHDQAGHLH